VKVFISEELDVSREVSTMAKTKGLPHILDLIGGWDPLPILMTLRASLRRCLRRR
jgi:hypothetical protein